MFDSKITDLTDITDDIFVPANFLMAFWSDCTIKRSTFLCSLPYPILLKKKKNPSITCQSLVVVGLRYACFALLLFFFYTLPSNVYLSFYRILSMAASAVSSSRRSRNDSSRSIFIQSISSLGFYV